MVMEVAFATRSLPKPPIGAEHQLRRVVRKPGARRMTDAESLGLPLGAFAKGDVTADLDIYALARLVTHIDKGAIDALLAFYASQLFASRRVFSPTVPATPWSL